MTVLERSVRNRIDVIVFPECDGGEIEVDFPNPHVEMILDLEEAERLVIMVASGIQEVRRARFKEALHEAESKRSQDG